ncbi:hypothetical protein Mlute_02360 [Meiothermus luteus]|jgi:hypothetical protein|uniref:Uncharacterized protein n=1 Tax=Meiothermus luteus TaxID=2026184 RepID=A0A399EKI8_9DEIN|nr:hypothetical protein [Meiothermus luteus]RIH82902.1 hypothetical protein Mlute_02360 [Meiothermus luteus]RMH54487.1 MAG: hypothetical protein D6684_09615 [Deinococcota bacterium]
MDTRGWVVRAVEALRFASEKEIARWLDEEGESFSRHELQKTLQQLVQEGVLELKNDLFRLRRKGSGPQAFERLFRD